MRRYLLVLLLLVLGGCEAAVSGPGDDGADQGQPPGDGNGPADQRLADGSPGPCTPLPAGCLCAAACSGGVCDNTACPCQAIPGVSYDKLTVSQPYSGDVSTHGDVNLLLRKWNAVSATKGLVDVGGPTDTTPPPQLYTLFADDRVPVFSAVYQVEAWDWSCNCPSGYLTSPEVTLAGMATQLNEVVHTPHSGYDIGGAHTAVVLYAAKNTITLKYTAEDNVVKGYTIHLAGICVEPALQALYDQCNAAGRAELPALKSRQPLGRAIGAEIQAAIRDTGSWMDPRVRKDWWQGK